MQCTVVTQTTAAKHATNCQARVAHERAFLLLKSKCIHLFSIRLEEHAINKANARYNTVHGGPVQGTTLAPV
jgi:hypothetical protein